MTGDGQAVAPTNYVGCVDLNLLECGGMVNPSNRFHLWIYRYRPSANAIIHTHTTYCSALSLTMRLLQDFRSAIKMNKCLI